ncbi:MAG: hypothetical protein V4630_11855, partial [Pseudomonadota bacterium]
QLRELRVDRFWQRLGVHVVAEIGALINPRAKQPNLFRGKFAVRRHLGAFRRFTYMPEYDMWAEKLCTVYLAQPVRRLGPPSEAGHTAVWLPVEEALARLGNAGDRAMLARLLR